MFNNRRWFLKFTIPLLLFAGLCADSVWRLGEAYPAVRQCRENPDHYDGREIWVGTVLVTQVHPDGFTVEDRGVQIRVRSDDKPATQTWVGLRGIFRKPDLLEATHMTRRPYYPAQRSGAYGLSMGIVLVGAWLFLKRFRLGIRGGLLHPREVKQPEAEVRG